MARFRNILLATTALMPLGIIAAAANPLGSQVVGGSANVQGTGTSTVTVTQSTQNAIINWQTFNIGSGETTQFVQPDSSSVTLNRVTGNLGASVLDGTLTANGRVFLVNPDGILFGAGSKINTGSFLATTNDIRNADFMAGRYQFNIPGLPNASIVNLGTITAQNGGFAALVAPGVRNTGTITANLGTVGLAAGNGFTLDFYGDKLITLGVNDSIAAKVIDVATGQPLNALVENDGKLKANGGRVELTAAAARQVVDSVINNTGVIEANSVGTKNGMIVLSAATASTKPAGTPTQTIKLSGKISAAGKQKNTAGGTIVVTGQNIQLTGATIDASGQTGGGKVLIGGDVGGGKGNAAVASNPMAALESFTVPNASTVSVDAATTIDASATVSGNGGKVVVWSDQATTFYGTINAQGGTLSGNGGFVETSGHQSLTYNGAVDTGAPHGTNGTLLLDPQDALITTTAGPGVVTVASIEAALLNGDVVVTTGSTGTDQGNITVAANISWANANALTLSAYKDIIVNANIVNTDGAAVNLRADNTGTGVGTVSFGSGATISTSGAVSIFYNPSVNPANSIVNTTSYLNPTENFSGNVIGGGALTAYMLVNSVYDLQNIQNNLSGDYALGKNIDASGTVTWNGGSGFNPIGSPGVPFSGLFDGGGNTIDKLTINSSNVGNQFSNIGLFAETTAGAVIRNVGLTNVSITDSDLSVVRSPEVGALVAENEGAILNSYVTGTVSVPVVSSGANYVGGLVGRNDGTITQSYSSANVSGGGYPSVVGGLVGANQTGGVIMNSYATGMISNGYIVGGLVGLNNNAEVEQSYATGNVSASGTGTPVSGAAGGLVGDSNQSSILGSYATGVVTGTNGAVVDAFESGVIYLSLAQARSQVTYTTDPATGSGWDFTQVWAINANINNGFPYLRWQVPSSTTATILQPQAAIIDVTVMALPEFKTYGNPDPTLAYEIVSGSLGPGVSFSGSLTRVAGQNVGSYTIQEGSLSLPSNYEITFLSSTLMIQPRPITVTAIPESKAFGAPDPTLFYSIGGLGLVGNDSLSGSLATTATTKSFPGTYAITLGTLGNPNYSITYIGANLTVTPNTQLVTASDQLFGQLKNLTQLTNIQVANSTAMFATSKSEWLINTLIAAQIIVNAGSAAGGELAPQFMSKTVGNALGWTDDAINLYNALQTGNAGNVADALFQIVGTKAAGYGVPYLLGLTGAAAVTTGAIAAADLVGSYDIGKVYIAPLVAPVIGQWLFDHGYR